MITTAQCVNGIWMGVVLIGLGLVPGLFQGIGDSLCTFADALAGQFGFMSRRRMNLGQPRWFALTGAVILCATLLAYSVR